MEWEIFMNEQKNWCKAIKERFQNPKGVYCTEAWIVNIW